MIFLKDIRGAVCDYYGISADDLVSRSHSRHTTYPRQVLMYLAREMTPRSFPAIAKHLSRSDHRCVFEGAKTIRDSLPHRPGLRAEVRYLRRKIARRVVIREALVA